MAKRTTETIKYNLNDRGRKYNGINRSNVNVQSMIALLNSDAVQERVETDAMCGYYGHQVRELYGLRVPEFVIEEVTGKKIYLEQAVRTVFLKAYPNGTVEHRQEFFNNQAGNHALRQYHANAGGFSSAVQYSRPNANGMLDVLEMYGFDYVNFPNFKDNVGSGKLYAGLDSMYGVSPELAEYTAQNLQSSMLETYQNIQELSALQDHAQQLEQQVSFFAEEQQKKMSRKERQEQRQHEVYTGLVGRVHTVGLDSLFSEAEEKLRLIPKIDYGEPEEEKQSRPKLGVIPRATKSNYHG